ncbi:serine protease easter-like [Homarus americanus]|uniref:serine protease easter-like n=1 Tax=Homarus americanus TaxID=6706 RepID=UPI001C46C0E9|nr:serine protease easter-like [Homarus americanus]
MVSVERGVGALVLLLLLFQLAHTKSATCQHDCIPVRQCPQLHWLLLHPSPENTDTLQRSTCAYKNSQPIVCCPRNAIKFPKTCGLSEHHRGGGRELPIAGYTWKALLGYRQTGSSRISFLCGGSVISERYILTSAHCVDASSTGGSKLEVVRVGEWDRSTEPDCMINIVGNTICSPPAQDFTIEEAIPHPNYNKRGQISDDIALIRLVSSIDLNGPWITSRLSASSKYRIPGLIYCAGHFFGWLGPI